jgi:hypothetical protein
MTCHRARAPETDVSPYIRKALERAALPISIRYRTYNHQERRAGAYNHFEISWPGRRRELFVFRNTADAANRAYFALVTELSNPGTLPAGSSGGCSVLSTPRGEL